MSSIADELVSQRDFWRQQCESVEAELVALGAKNERLREEKTAVAMERNKYKLESLQAFREVTYYKALHDHIQGHLAEGEVVICKICGKSANELGRQALKEDSDE